MGTVHLLSQIRYGIFKYVLPFTEFYAHQNVVFCTDTTQSYDFIILQWHGFMIPSMAMSYNATIKGI